VRLIISGTGEDIWVRLEGETPKELRVLEQSAAQGDWTMEHGVTAIGRLRALAARLGYPYVQEQDSRASRPPRLVVVQRGELALAEQLRALARPGVPVISDRRERDRRTADHHSLPIKRRRQDRRRPPPRTWGALRFLVVEATESLGEPAHWLDAHGRCRPTLGCETCGRELTRWWRPRLSILRPADEAMIGRSSRARAGRANAMKCDRACLLLMGEHLRANLVTDSQRSDGLRRSSQMCGRAGAGWHVPRSQRPEGRRPTAVFARRYWRCSPPTGGERAKDESRHVQGPMDATQGSASAAVGEAHRRRR
jgi:hypothetical protein